VPNMDPLTQKAISSSFTPETSASASSDKGKPSRFREKLEEVAASNQTASAPQAAASLPDELQASRMRLDQAKSRVEALPSSSTVDGIRQRLSALDVEYQRMGNRFDLVSGSADPQKLLQLQKDMYQLTENVNIVSKMVDSATGAVKSILQTNV
jgi:hypothetical protein